MSAAVQTHRPPTSPARRPFRSGANRRLAPASTVTALVVDTAAARPSIADPHAEVLALLDGPRRRGLVSWMATRYYDGWRPDRAEVADLVAVELGVLHIDESIDRQHLRRRGHPVADILPLVHARLAERRSRMLLRSSTPIAQQTPTSRLSDQPEAVSRHGQWSDGRR